MVLMGWPGRPTQQLLILILLLPPLPILTFVAIVHVITKAHPQ